MLAQRGWGDRFDPNALCIVSAGGRAYAVPVDYTAVVLWINRDLFKKHGLEPPGTFSDLERLIDEFKRHGVTPMALGDTAKWPGAFYYMYLAVRIGGLEPFRKATARTPGGTFEDPSFIEAGRKLRRLSRIGAFPVGFDALDNKEARAMFFRGDAAMMLTGTWLLSYALTEKAAFIPKLRAVPFPVVSGGRGDPGIVVGGVNAAYAVSNSAPQREAAIGLAMALASDESMKAWAALGRIPALRKDLAEPMLTSQARPVADILYNARGVQLYYDQALAPALARVHKDTVHALLAPKSDMTPERAAALMEKAARSAIR
jgi:raffinose/stachyose/melibiose transport system substrate-binding protein